MTTRSIYFIIMNIALLSCTPSHANATEGGPYISVDVEFEGFNFIPQQRERYRYNAIFDTSIPPTITKDGPRWQGIYSTFERAIFPNWIPDPLSSSAVAISPTSDVSRVYSASVDFIPAHITYNDDENQLVLSFESLAEQDPHIPYTNFRIVMIDPIGFDSSTKTLPDDPSGYQITPILSLDTWGLYANMFGPLAFNQYHWPQAEDDFPSTSILQLNFQTADNPYPNNCFADLNNDGALDFFDVSTYIQL